MDILIFGSLLDPDDDDGLTLQQLYDLWCAHLDELYDEEEVDLVFDQVGWQR